MVNTRKRNYDQCCSNSSLFDKRNKRKPKKRLPNELIAELINVIPNPTLVFTVNHGVSRKFEEYRRKNTNELLRRMNRIQNNQILQGTTEILLQAILLIKLIHPTIRYLEINFLRNSVELSYLPNDESLNTKKFVINSKTVINVKELLNYLIDYRMKTPNPLTMVEDMTFYFRNRHLPFAQQPVIFEMTLKEIAENKILCENALYGPGPGIRMTIPNVKKPFAKFIVDQQMDADENIACIKIMGMYKYLGWPNE